MLRFIRAETHGARANGREILPPGILSRRSPELQIWVPLPAPWTRSAFVEHMRATGISASSPSDAFVANGSAPEAVRVCFGGPAGRAQIKWALEYMTHALTESPALASAFL